MSRADRATRRRLEQKLKNHKPMWRWQKQSDGTMVLIRMKPWPRLPNPPAVEGRLLK